ncbi:MAG: hypothetical protein E6R13_00975 [Spirochaetes bacterium]|nr:MAG: hypothetical protein E6R13_00975 [Spirochaetota bacterium]
MDFKLEYFDVLALDSIYNLLSFNERIDTHLYIRNKTEKLNPKSEKIFNWIKQNYWSPPETKYDRNKTLKFYNEKTESFENLEKYQTTYPKITKAVYGQLS